MGRWWCRIRCRRFRRRLRGCWPRGLFWKVCFFNLNVKCGVWSLVMLGCAVLRGERGRVVNARVELYVTSIRHGRTHHGNTQQQNEMKIHLTPCLGVGVGDSTASPTSALLLSVLQESTGRIATILFAHRLGTALEPECKMYRLAADVFNDTAMVLDCLSPAFPKPIRVAVLSFSSCLRALCGVCAGSAKASLSAHFARKGNLGEVNAVSLLCPFLCRE
jgi:hypothetical protein